MKWLGMSIFGKTSPRKTLDLETANKMLANAPIVNFKVSGDFVGENDDKTVRILNFTPSAGIITDYTYDTQDFRAHFRAYRFWKRKSGYIIKIDLRSFNPLQRIDKTKKGVNVDVERVISNIKSFFHAAYLDVLKDSTPVEKDGAAFNLQFVESL